MLRQRPASGQQRRSVAAGINHQVRSAPRCPTCLAAPRPFAHRRRPLRCHGSQYRQAVLQRFYRLDRSRSTPGIGLGLSLVGAVAGLHNATLALENKNRGCAVYSCSRRGLDGEIAPTTQSRAAVDCGLIRPIDAQRTGRGTFRRGWSQGAGRREGGTWRVHHPPASEREISR